MAVNTGSMVNEIKMGTPLCLENSDGIIQPFEGWFAECDSWEVIPGYWQIAVVNPQDGMSRMCFTDQVHVASVPGRVYRSALGDYQFGENASNDGSSA